MSSILIFSPVAEFAAPEPDEQPLAASADFDVRGRTIGFRSEGNWQSWLHILSRWTPRLEADGATVVTHVADGPRVGPDSPTTTRGVADWGAGVEFAVSGLGTCGSCTSYTVVDALTAKGAGAVACAVVTTEFRVHARSIARHLGSPDLPVLGLPHPLEGRPADELDAIADEYYPVLLAQLSALDAKAAVPA